MDRWVKTVAAKLDDMSLIPGAQGEREGAVL